MKTKCKKAKKKQSTWQRIKIGWETYRLDDFSIITAVDEVDALSLTEDAKLMDKPAVKAGDVVLINSAAHYMRTFKDAKELKAFLDTQIT